MGFYTLSFFPMSLYVVVVDLPNAYHCYNDLRSGQFCELAIIRKWEIIEMFSFPIISIKTKQNNLSKQFFKTMLYMVTLYKHGSIFVQ